MKTTGQIRDHVHPAQVRAAFGQQALQILAQAGIEASWLLLSRVATAAEEAGEGAVADQLLGEGVKALRSQHSAGATVEPFEASYLLLESGRRLLTRGDLDRAVEMFEEVAALAAEGGQEADVAVARGQIADILQARGELDEALRIRTEEELPVLERLGDLESLAHLKFRMAQIRLQKGIERQEDLQAILDDLVESFAITRKLGLAEGIAAVGDVLGPLFAQLDEQDAARVVLGEAQAAYAKLGRQEAAAEIGRLLGGLPDQ